MDKRIILAVAGAGKTYYICNKLNATEKNLIIAFTHENIKNIKKELKKAHGEIPKSTIIMTFDSFVYQHIIQPFEPTIAEFWNSTMPISKGITLITPPSNYLGKSGNQINNKEYKKKSEIEHYISKFKLYYCSRLSELVMYIGKILIEKSANRLNKFFDRIFIDEFQDFRNFDYDLIVSLSRHLKSIVLVGDFYQHSVSGTNNSGKPFKNRGKLNLEYQSFVEQLKKQGFTVDETSLSRSRRCSQDICNFIRNKLNISIYSEGLTEGKIIWVTEKNVKEILENDSILKLVFKDSNKLSFNAISWSYSKGDTYDNVCVILTETFENLDSDEFTRKDNQKIVSYNKLYVALSRCTGDLYLIKKSLFDSVADNYRIHTINRS